MIIVQQLIEHYGNDVPRIIYRLRDLFDIGEEKAMELLQGGEIQEAMQDFVEGDHPRDEDGKFSKKDGSQGFPKQGGLPKQKSLNLPEPEPISQSEQKRQYYESKYEEYAQYDESPDGWPPEPIHPYSPEPDNNQIATAYNVLRDYPEMDEQETIKQAWHADQVRTAHTAHEQRNRETMAAGLPTMRVTGRVKSRRSMIEKMGRKSKYKSVDDIGDNSADRIITADLGESLQAAQFISQNFDVVKTDDYTTQPLAGYRAIQMDIRNPDGSISEVQIKTPNQDTWANFFHDNLYKMKHKGAEAAEINEHMVEMQMYAAVTSEYFYQIDSGNIAAVPPDCPPRIRRLLGCLT